MVPPPHPLTPSPWWFRAAVLAAALPLLSSLVVAVDVLGDDTLVHATTGIPATTVVSFQDRWSALLTFGQPGWPATLTALGCLALAFAAATGRPERLSPPESRVVLSWVASGCAAWALGSAVLTTWYQFAGAGGADPTVPETAPPGTGLFLPQYLSFAGQGTFAALVAGATLLWCGRVVHDGGDEDDSPDEAGARTR